MSFRRFHGLVLYLILGVVVGCGNSERGNSERGNSERGVLVTVAPEDRGVPDVNVDETDPSRQKSVGRRSDEVWVDEEGRKYIGRVPYDVFFDNPLEIASEGQAVNSQLAPTGTNTSGTVAVAGEMPSAGPIAGTAELNAGGDWDIQLPVDVLVSEVKHARNFLKEKLQSVANYNSAVTMIPVRAAIIALLAEIAAKHHGKISWKEDARYVRDLARGMNERVLKRGSKDQRRLLRIFEDLADTLNRSRPTGLNDPSTEISLSDAAGMGMIMKRVQEAEQRLRTEVTDRGFSSQSLMVQHEASLMGGLAHAITLESYGYSDDADFVGHANRLIEAGQEMRDAAESGEFAMFELSLSKAAGACQSCHRDYKSN